MKVHFFIISPRHKRGDAGALSLPIQPLSPVKQRHARVAASPLYFTFFWGGAFLFPVFQSFQVTAALNDPKKGKSATVWTT